jgi:Na+/alanine symporter
MMFGLLFVTAVLVFLRAFQSQNVVHGHYRAAVFTSYAMAIAEVMLVLYIIDGGVNTIPWIGSGGALGVVGGMYFHRKYLQKD